MLKKIFFSIIFLILITSFSFSNENINSTIIIKIHGTIELGLSAFIKRCSDEALNKKVKNVIFKIDTFGGRVDAALDICETIKKLQDNNINCIAFIENHAWSAGALIALACKNIYMQEQATIGSAEPRKSSFMGSGKTDEKTISALRAKFKAIAEINNHNALISVAMVDKDIALKFIKKEKENLIIKESELKKNDKKTKNISTITEKGKLLNITAKEAQKYNLINDIVKNFDEFLEKTKIKPNDLIEKKINVLEKLVRILTHPMLSSFLLMIGFMGILFELKVPGWGISGTLGVLALVLFFGAHYITGLANIIEIVLFLSGLILIALEIFVIPGFGLAGISGFICLISGIYMALVKHPIPIEPWDLFQTKQALFSVTSIIVISFFSFFLILKNLHKTFIGKKLILSKTQNQNINTYNNAENLIGLEGKALTMLRPAGRGIFTDNDTIYDIITEGDFIKKNELIKIINVIGNKIIVKKV